MDIDPPSVDGLSSTEISTESLPAPMHVDEDKTVVDGAATGAAVKPEAMVVEVLGVRVSPKAVAVASPDAMSPEAEVVMGAMLPEKEVAGVVPEVVAAVLPAETVVDMPATVVAQVPVTPKDVVKELKAVAVTQKMGQAHRTYNTHVHTHTHTHTHRHSHTHAPTHTHTHTRTHTHISTHTGQGRKGG
jgi:hypothetical protein